MSQLLHFKIYTVLGTGELPQINIHHKITKLGYLDSLTSKYTVLGTGELPQINIHHKITKLGYLDSLQSIRILVTEAALSVLQSSDWVDNYHNGHPPPVEMAVSPSARLLPENGRFLNGRLRKQTDRSPSRTHGGCERTRQDEIAEFSNGNHVTELEPTLDQLTPPHQTTNSPILPKISARKSSSGSSSISPATVSSPNPNLLAIVTGFHKPNISACLRNSRCCASGLSGVASTELSPLHPIILPHLRFRCAHPRRFSGNRPREMVCCKLDVTELIGRRIGLPLSLKIFSSPLYLCTPLRPSKWVAALLAAIHVSRPIQILHCTLSSKHPIHVALGESERKMGWSWAQIGSLNTNLCKFLATTINTSKLTEWTRRLPFGDIGQERGVSWG
ncbi:hypothetical protein DFH08DRAFT_798696 [Mycena albidolilacea]|uniref:Uncharacterized protein n=1 Tax=Mycena albidolilacea TaxID=1033008 RepID=A0AAD7AP63_9AGAR|nr:hypothetical protein DFH08DRAFT_798696 [Mycena albidolilacea]